MKKQKKAPSKAKNKATTQVANKLKNCVNCKSAEMQSLPNRGPREDRARSERTQAKAQACKACRAGAPIKCERNPYLTRQAKRVGTSRGWMYFMGKRSG